MKQHDEYNETAAEEAAESPEMEAEELAKGVEAKKEVPLVGKSLQPEVLKQPGYHC